MRKLEIILVLVASVLIPIASIYVCFASPSANFYEEGGHIYDDWQVCRTYAGAEDGYLAYKELATNEFEFQPLIAYESLGKYTDVAYSVGEQFADKYPDRHQRAEKVFEYVRDTVTYLHDTDQFDRVEYAVNADELATIIQKEGRAYADCEEHAILLAIMYQGAGFRSAIVDCVGHVGVLVYLPGYEKANVVFHLEDEPGWVWGEATGDTNHFGWYPEGQVEVLAVREILSKDTTLLPSHQPAPPDHAPPQPSPWSIALTGILPVVLFVLMTIGIIILVRKRRRRAHSQ